MAKQTKILFEREIDRSRYRRAFVRQILGGAATAGAYWATIEAERRGLASPFVVDLGTFTTILLGGLFAVRGIVFFFYWLTRRDEIIRFYTRGFVWIRGTESFKYPYQELVRYREAWHGIYIGDYPLLQWGANTLEMRDGQVFKIKPRHGSMKKFARAFRPYGAYVTAIRIGQTLRKGEPVPLNRKVTVYPGGVEVGGDEIRWAEMGVKRRRGTLILQEYDGNRRRYRTIKRLRISKTDNADGFFDLAQGTIRNHNQKFQPHKIQAPTRTPAGAAVRR
jgi:hypothetical protein